MKVLFVYMGAESLGVEYLVASARAAGHEADLAFDPSVFGGHLMMDIPAAARFFDLRPKILKRIIVERPDVVGFSCLSSNYLWALSIAEKVKKHTTGIRTIFGGPHVTALPERVIAEPAVDALITGEADNSFPGLLSDWLETGASQRPGVWEKRNGEIFCGEEPSPPTDLDSLPFPSKDIYYRKAPILKRDYSIMAARGCPYHCTYCYKLYSHSSLDGANRVRLRSVDNVIAELEIAVRDRQVRIVHFRDDVFTMQKSWLEVFSESYRAKIAIPYHCFIHPSALDEYKANLLRDSGCAYAVVGVQSVNEHQRRTILNRHYSNDNVRSTVKLLKDRNIIVFLDHIIGLPGDTPDMMLEAAIFYNELRADKLLTYWLTYFPGTEILRTGLSSGFLTESDIERIESGNEGCITSDSGVSRNDARLNKFRVLFSLIPVLPPKLIDFIINKRIYRWLPGSGLAYNLIVAYKAIVSSDVFFLYYLRYFISRKHVP
jgi:anaerobic magnesium-protoporphyrin IX monomethyl ester cyclase